MPNKLSPKTFMILSGLTVSGLAAYSFYRAKKLTKGTIVIDLTDNVPAFIKTYIHQRKWLPIKIEVETIINAIKGTADQRKKAQRILSELGKYISITVKE